METEGVNVKFKSHEVKIKSFNPKQCQCVNVNKTS